MKNSVAKILNPGDFFVFLALFTITKKKRKYLLMTEIQTSIELQEARQLQVSMVRLCPGWEESATIFLDSPQGP